MPQDQCQPSNPVSDVHLKQPSAQHPGHEQLNLTVQDQKAVVLCPRHPAPGRPWVWHGEFYDHQPQLNQAMLERGLHVVYLAIPNHFGSPKAVAYWNALYELLTTTYQLAPRVALIGLSRGGLYAYNWAWRNPNRVACIYADAPVCDFKSWPAGKGNGVGSPENWQMLLTAYDFENEAQALAYPDNPIDRLQPLAKAGVPLLHVYGDVDEVVPHLENTVVLAERYRELGGNITLIAKPGVAHHPHGLADPEPILSFIFQHGL